MVGYQGSHSQHWSLSSCRSIARGWLLCHQGRVLSTWSAFGLSGLLALGASVICYSVLHLPSQVGRLLQG